MHQELPMFPLNTVLFPGIGAPLHVFEERYRALVIHLLGIEDPTQRVFGVTAIREGYEVGDHGAQSLHTTGVLVQLSEVERYEDGRFDIEVIGRQRLRLHRMHPPDGFPRGEVELLEESVDDSAQIQALRTRVVFERYRQRLGALRGGPVLAGSMPEDPVFLSWTLAATCLLTMDQRQRLLETDDVGKRLSLIRRQLREEMRAMQAVPSLPATQVARTRWSPN